MRVCYVTFLIPSEGWDQLTHPRQKACRCPASVGLTTQERRNIQQILGISIRPQTVADRALALHRRLVEGSVVTARQRLTTHHPHRRRFATRHFTSRVMARRRVLLAFPRHERTLGRSRTA